VEITVYTWADLVNEHLRSAIGSESLREALPPGFASRRALKPELRQKLIHALDRLRADAAPDEFIESFTARVRASHIPRPAPFQADVMVIDLDSMLKMDGPRKKKFIFRLPIRILWQLGCRQ
jgi:hypothetical protein